MISSSRVEDNIFFQIIFHDLWKSSYFYKIAEKRQREKILLKKTFLKGLFFMSLKRLKQKKCVFSNKIQLTI